MNSFFIDLNNDISVINIWIDNDISKVSLDRNGINQIFCMLLTRGCKNYDNFAFSDYIDSFGAELIIEAYEDGISISLKSLKQYFHKLYPLLKALIEEPNLYEKEFIICKKYALDTIIKAKENPFNKAFDNWKKETYNDHPYSNSSNGTKINIDNLKYEDILNEYKSFQKLNKFSLTNNTIYGTKNIQNFKQTITKKKFNLFSQSFINRKFKFIENYSNSKQTIMILGSQSCPHCHQDNLTLKILESYLSFGMSSLLFKTFREKNGLTYDSGVYFPIRKFNSPFLIYLSVSEKNAIFAYKIIIEIWNDLLTKLIPNKELSLAKLKLKSSFLHDYQTLEEITFRKVRLIGLNMDPFYDEKAIEFIENINSKEILKVTNKYLKFPTFSLSGSKYICNKIKALWQKRN